MDMSVFDLIQDRHRPIELPHGGPDGRRAPLPARMRRSTHAVGVEAHLYGSLALTGVGHATDKAVILGLMGETPQGVDPDSVEDKLAEAELDGVLKLLGTKEVPFTSKTGLVWHKQSTLPEHPNGMRFVLQLATAASSSASIIRSAAASLPPPANPDAPGGGEGRPGGIGAVPLRHHGELLAHGQRDGLSIPAMLRANELARMSEAELDAGLDRIWQVMRDCIAHGLVTEGQLPGGLNVKRRAAKLWKQAHCDAGNRRNELPHDATHQVTCTRWPSTKKTRPAAGS
jgi:L-serine dehydratase